ncbi:MAG: LuxR C-terminal-related transcriptional regulator [Rhizobiaceae bacterium]
MLKLVTNADAALASDYEIRTTLQRLNECSNLNDACVIAQEHIKHLGHDLVSVIFCGHDDTVPAIRPFRDLPKSMVDLAPKLQQVGGCPPKKEAQRLLRPFDWKQIPRSRHRDFISQRFLTEVQKLPYSSVLAMPVVIGGGVGVFTVGMNDTDFNSQMREDLIVAVCQIATAMISRFPELAKLFEPKTLSTLQASALLFAIQGLSNAQIAESLGLGEVAVGLVLKSAEKKLNAANLAQTVAKALAFGEFSHMQIGEHDLI